MELTMGNLEWYKKCSSQALMNTETNLQVPQMQGSSRLAEWLLAPQEGLYGVRSVSQSVQ